MRLIIVGEVGTGRETERDRERDKERDRETERDRERQNQLSGSYLSRLGLSDALGLVELASP